MLFGLHDCAEACESGNSGLWWANSGSGYTSSCRCNRWCNQLAALKPAPLLGFSVWLH